jgi:hypothetical protein
LNYSIKGNNKFWPSVTAVPVLLVFAAWQFYRFATFRNLNGLTDLQGGRFHLWVAILATLLAAVAGFFVIYVSRQQDDRNDLHIT